MARVELHGIKPYQPEPYLASGGVGNVGAQSAAVASAHGAGRTFVLGTEPASWQSLGYNDSAWTLTPLTVYPAPTFFVADSETYTDSFVPSAVWLYRRTFSLPAGTITGAPLQVTCDDHLSGIWINGTLLAGTDAGESFGGMGHADTISVPPALLLPGASNVIALKITNVDFTTALAYLLSVTYAGSGQLLAISSPQEGDLAVYHGGAWTRLPIGTSGQELTVAAGDPAWTDQPASYTLPTASATTLGGIKVGSGLSISAGVLAATGGGTVTSVALSAPSVFSVSGTPVTGSGTLALTFAGGQSANRVLASPDGSSGAVSLRALVGNDIPVDASTIIVSAGTIKGNYQAGSGIGISGNTISATGSGGTVTSVALSMPGIFTVSGSPVTGAGTLAVTLATETAATVLAGPISGSAAAPAFRALQGSDLPAAASAGGHVHAHGHFL